jgi:hypothetical protein
MPLLLFLHSPIQLTTFHNNERQPRRQNSRLQYSPHKKTKTKKQQIAIEVTCLEEKGREQEDKKKKKKAPPKKNPKEK